MTYSHRKVNITLLHVVAVNSFPITNGQARVLLHIVRRGMRSGECYESNASIAAQTNMSVRQIQRILSELSEGGFIRILKDSRKGNFTKAEITEKTISMACAIVSNTLDKHDNMSDTNVTKCHNEYDNMSQSSGQNVTMNMTICHNDCDKMSDIRSKEERNIRKKEKGGDICLKLGETARESNDIAIPPLLSIDFFDVVSEWRKAALESTPGIPAQSENWWLSKVGVLISKCDSRMNPTYLRNIVKWARGHRFWGRYWTNPHELIKADRNGRVRIHAMLEDYANGHSFAFDNPFDELDDSDFPF